jgi:hypothetical protein
MQDFFNYIFLKYIQESNNILITLIISNCNHKHRFRMITKLKINRNIKLLI